MFRVQLFMNEFVNLVCYLRQTKLIRDLSYYWFLGEILNNAYNIDLEILACKIMFQLNILWIAFWYGVVCKKKKNWFIGFARSSGVPWPSSNKVSTLPQFMTLRCKEDEKPLMVITSIYGKYSLDWIKCVLGPYVDDDQRLYLVCFCSVS